MNEAVDHLQHWRVSLNDFVGHFVHFKVYYSVVANYFIKKYSQFPTIWSVIFVRGFVVGKVAATAALLSVSRRTVVMKMLLPMSQRLRIFQFDYEVTTSRAIYSKLYTSQSFTSLLMVCKLGETELVSNYFSVFGLIWLLSN